jgi:hypothetical protein
MRLGIACAAMFFSHYVSWGLLRLLLYPVPAALRDLLMVEESRSVHRFTSWERIRI